MADASLKTPLHAWHSSHNGRMVEFAGWSMPIQYSSIVDEHLATRKAIGVFDISHMGRLEFEGEAALAFLDRLVTRRVARLKPGGVRYGLVTNPQGGILDDVLVYHLPRPDGSSQVMMVVNASNRAKILAWLESHKQPDEDVTVIDRSLQTAMIAVQGPSAVDLVDPMLNVDLAAMRYYTGTIAQLDGDEVVVSRTGYTGESGCELIVPNEAAVGIWEKVLTAGESAGALPVGLAARDTLRLEAGMPLYGHELTEEIHPFQAGLRFAVQLDKHEFVGSEALIQARDDTSCPVRVGLQLDGRRVPREKYPVRFEGEVVGEVTSGTFSPTFERPLAMAYVTPNASNAGTGVEIDIRGRSTPAEVVDLPFYTRTS